MVSRGHLEPSVRAAHDGGDRIGLDHQLGCEPLRLLLRLQRRRLVGIADRDQVRHLSEHRLAQRRARDIVRFG